MPDEPAQLDRDALLTLYVAGETTLQQQAEVESLIVADPALAGELKLLREAMERSSTSLRDLDGRQRPPVSAAVAVRRVERAMQQWTIDRLRKPAEQPRRPLHLPWWGYPAAAAAIVIVGFLVWSGKQEILPTEPNSQAKTNILMADAEALAERLEGEFDDEPAIITDQIASGQTSAADPQEMGVFFINPAEDASW